MTFYGAHLEDSLRTLREVVAELRLTSIPSIPPHPSAAGAPLTPHHHDGPLSQDSFWADVQSWLPHNIIAIADAGSAFYGALTLRMPNDSDLLGQPVWSSIGYTLPATLGACLAAPDKRSVLFIGDGSAQLTIQELATILHRGCAPIIFLINNDGYAVERAIQSPQATYQDITPWDWTALPAAFAPGVSAETVTVRTRSELQKALEIATATPDRLVLIEVILPKLDYPQLLADLGAGLAMINSK